jgi:hypothetical protein
LFLKALAEKLVVSGPDKRLLLMRLQKAGGREAREVRVTVV